MSEAVAEPKPRLRWYQYRLAHLFVLVTVVAVISAGAASFWTWYLRARVEYRRAAAPIENLGGRVEGGDPNLGVNGIAQVDLYPFHGNGPFTDADLGTLGGHLETLPNLKALSLHNVRVTDTGLVHISGLTALEKLNLNFTQVTDAGLVHLQKLTNLRELWLCETQVTHDGVKKLQQALPNCEIYN